MQVASAESASVKDQVHDQVPKIFKELKFGIQSSQDIVNQAVLEVSDKLLYDVDKDRSPIPHGPLDPQLVKFLALEWDGNIANTCQKGISSRSGTCQTCKGSLHECNGHFGHVRLALPTFHIGYLKFIIMALQNICKV